MAIRIKKTVLFKFHFNFETTCFNILAKLCAHSALLKTNRNSIESKKIKTEKSRNPNPENKLTRLFPKV